jgi:hypothetical protein
MTSNRSRIDILCARFNAIFTPNGSIHITFLSIVCLDEALPDFVSRIEDKDLQIRPSLCSVVPCSPIGLPSKKQNK